MPFCQSGVGQSLAGLPPATNFPFRNFPANGEQEGRATPTAFRGALAATARREEGGGERREGDEKEKGATYSGARFLLNKKQRRRKRSLLVATA